MSDLSPQPKDFSQRVADFLTAVDYRRARTDEDLAEIQRLRYDANLREGAIAANRDQLLQDRYDELENCVNVGVWIDNRLVSALRLHLLARESADSALLEAYPDLVRPRVARGLRIIDITRLAADFTAARQHRYLAYATVRISMMASEHYEADLILAAVRTEHLPFYRREFLAETLSEPRPYPSLIKPLSLFEIDYRRNRRLILERHSFHESTVAERDALFGKAQWPSFKDALALA
jgi:hypothetical protein